MLCTVLNNKGSVIGHKFCNVFIEFGLVEEEYTCEIERVENIPSYFFIRDISTASTFSRNLEEICLIAENPVELMQWFSKGGIFGFIKTKNILTDIELYTKWMDFCRLTKYENNEFCKEPSFPFEQKLYLFEECEKLSSAIHALFSPVCSQKDLKTGVHELLINALEHGNLGIDRHYKQELIKSGNLISALMMNFNQNLEKYVSVTGDVVMHNGRRAVKISIKDFGKGFNWREIAKQELTAYTGRGLHLAKHITFDDIIFNERGNHVNGYVYI